MAYYESAGVQEGGINDANTKTKKACREYYTQTSKNRGLIKVFIVRKLNEICKHSFFMTIPGSISILVGLNNKSENMV